MIHWLWLIPAIIAGTSFGIILAACYRQAAEADRQIEELERNQREEPPF